MSNTRRVPPGWFSALDRFIRLGITGLSCTLLVLMAIFTVYTVVMRYIFHNPPFWGDTISLFCNIWLVFMAYSLAVRDREEISSEALYDYLPRLVVIALGYTWQFMTFSFGLFLLWFGFDAALDVPGQYWELGGMPKTIPMMIMPISGFLIATMAAISITEDALGWRVNNDSGDIAKIGIPI